MKEKCKIKKKQTGGGAEKNITDIIEYFIKPKTELQKYFTSMESKITNKLASLPTALPLPPPTSALSVLDPGTGVKPPLALSPPPPSALSSALSSPASPPPSALSSPPGKRAISSPPLASSPGGGAISSKLKESDLVKAIIESIKKNY